MNENRPPAPVLKNIYGWQAGAPWDAAIIIPARDESARIEACLHAVADAIEQSQMTAGVVLCVNDTQDDTAKKAASVLQERRLGNLIVDLRFPSGTGGVGRARDLGCRLSQRMTNAPEILLTTDADSRVKPDWVTANLAELSSADIVFGTIVPDPAELAQLAPHLAKHGTIEEDYRSAAIRLANRLDPLPHDPDPNHRTPSGASIALSAEALRRLGGIPWHQVSEDRELALQAEALDLRIRHASRPEVITSCRLNGRTAGGMASTLQERCVAIDPYCDPWLERAHALATRYRAKGELRAVWPNAEECRRIAQRLLGAGPVPHAENYYTFGRFWQALENTHPGLKRMPIRHSDAARELPSLRCHMDGNLLSLPAHRFSRREQELDFRR
ncbi:glycosyltransferase [Yoonia sp.]|uniref:glycosyltransferase n=1 Tax=Yoonia sp. TaxID=2212373 RepID=UPI003919E699